MHLMLCLLTLSTLVYVALTQHLIQSAMRCENCIDSVDIDSIECIRYPCLVLTVSTYMKLDSDGSQGISDSLPRITLSETVTPVNIVGHDGVEPDTTRSKLTLEGVMSMPVSKNDNLSVQDAEAAPPNSTATEGVPVEQRKSHNLHPVTPVTPVNTALKGVTQKSPALQSTEGVTSNTVGDSKKSGQLTPAYSALEGVMPKTPIVQSSNASETTTLGIDVTLENDTYTENQSNLPDLVVNRNECVQPVLLALN